MEMEHRLEVAVLLATYNGEPYVEEQLRSCSRNSISYTMHWSDDLSTDLTREIVRRNCQELGITLREWHPRERQGVPGAFFRLIECVEADIYLFCDQDDVWQPGKIDATVEAIKSELTSPILCFSDPWLFDSKNPSVRRRLSDLAGKPPDVLEESRMFMPICASGHTQGFTRSLRDIFLSHRLIARSHAWMHDVWMYNIAVACGGARMLCGAPTTLWRQHDNSATATIVEASTSKLVKHFRVTQYLRRVISRQARGFISAAETLPPGDRLNSLLEVARLVQTLDDRQSIRKMIELSRRRALWPTWKRWIWFTVICFLWSAKPREVKRGTRAGK